ncbi:MAG: CaiB/BaiF CoA transferase family protein [Burkholderiaceae bacterium]
MSTSQIPSSDSDANNGQTRPFSGYRILDFSQVIAGPVASQLLNASGAQVIKVEAPIKGDQLRHMKLSKGQDTSRASSTFTAINRGKHSITLDLKSAAGQATAKRLASACDVVVENFRPGVIDRLGLGYEVMKQARPDIIFCSVSGYGQTGPLSKRPAYDSAIQAASGMMSFTGHPETGPTRTGYTPVDVSAGLLAAFAISSALLRRERTGLGQQIDVAMLDAASMLAMTGLTGYLDDGSTPALMGNASPAHCLTADCFKASDGYLMVSAITPPHGEAVMKCLGLPANIWHDYLPLAADSEAAEQLRQQVNQAFETQTIDHWGHLLQAQGVAWERVNTVAEAGDLAQHQHRSLIERVPPREDDDNPAQHTAPGGRRTFGGAFLADADGPEFSGATTPILGNATESVLREIGLSDEEVKSLADAGAFG